MNWNLNPQSPRRKWDENRLGDNLDCPLNILLAVSESQSDRLGRLAESLASSDSDVPGALCAESGRDRAYEGVAAFFFKGSSSSRLQLITERLEAPIDNRALGTLPMCCKCDFLQHLTNLPHHSTIRAVQSTSRRPSHFQTNSLSRSIALIRYPRPAKNEAPRKSRERLYLPARALKSCFVPGQASVLFVLSIVLWSFSSKIVV